MATFPVEVELPNELIDSIVVEVMARLTTPEPESVASPYLTTAQAAEYLRCTRQRIHDLVSAGRLSRFKEGRRTLVLREELEALIALDRRRRP